MCVYVCMYTSRESVIRCWNDRVIRIETDKLWRWSMSRTPFLKPSFESIRRIKRTIRDSTRWLSGFDTSLLRWVIENLWNLRTCFLFCLFFIFGSSKECLFNRFEIVARSESGNNFWYFEKKERRKCTCSKILESKFRFQRRKKSSNRNIRAYREWIFQI